MLTPEQKITLSQYIIADPVLSSYPAGPDGAFAIAADLSNAATPPFYVWKTTVYQDEITQNGFAWVEVDGLSVGKARIWEWMFDNDSRTCNPSKPNVRAGIVECWSGTAQRNAVQAVVFSHCRRPANVLEKLFASGVGTTGVPATMTIEGTISYSDVMEAMNW